MVGSNTGRDAVEEWVFSPTRRPVEFSDPSTPFVQKIIVLVGIMKLHAV